MNIERESPEEQELFERMENTMQFMSISVDDYMKLSDELALARVLIRELGDRLAKLEKTEPVKMLEYICVCGKGMKFESKDGIVAPQRTWFGLTDEEKLIANQMWRVMDADGFIKAIEAKLKEKNT